MILQSLCELRRIPPASRTVNPILLLSGPNASFRQDLLEGSKWPLGKNPQEFVPSRTNVSSSTALSRLGSFRDPFTKMALYRFHEVLGTERVVLD